MLLSTVSRLSQFPMCVNIVCVMWTHCTYELSAIANFYSARHIPYASTEYPSTACMNCVCVRECSKQSFILSSCILNLKRELFDLDKLLVSYPNGSMVEKYHQTYSNIQEKKKQLGKSAKSMMQWTNELCTHAIVQLRCLLHLANLIYFFFFSGTRIHIQTVAFLSHSYKWILFAVCHGWT